MLLVSATSVLAAANAALWLWAKALLLCTGTNSLCAPSTGIQEVGS